MSNPDTVAATSPRKRAAMPMSSANGPGPAPAPRKAELTFIDPEKDFGEIVGIFHECESARYTQGGRCFDAEGILIPGSPVVTPSPRVLALAKERKRQAKVARERYYERMKLVPGSIATRVGERKGPSEPTARTALRQIVNQTKRAHGIAVAEPGESED